jgi:O-Antigen ligase
MTLSFNPNSLGLRAGIYVPLMLASAALVVYWPSAALPAVLGTIASVAILVNPFVGVPIIFLLGMIGDVQHFAMGLSLAKPVCLLVLLGLTAKFACGKLPLRHTGLELPLTAFLFVYCAGASRNIGEGLSWVGLVTMLGYPVAFLLVLNLVRSPRQLGWVIATIAAGTLLASFPGIIEHYDGYNVLSLLKNVQPHDAALVADDWHRSLGLTRDPNETAYPHLLAIPLLIAAAASSRKLWVRGALTAITATSAFALAITFSRGAYLGIALALAWLLFKLPSGDSWRALAIAVAGLALVFCLVTPQVLWARFGLLPEQAGGQSDRWIQYATGIRLLWANPVFGSGSNAYRMEMNRQVLGMVDVHSNVLSVAVDSGLVGLAFLLWLVVAYVQFVRRGFASMPWSPPKYYAVGTCAGLIAFLVQGFFIGNMGWFVLWGAAALPVCCVLAHRDTVGIQRPALYTWQKHPK